MSDKYILVGRKPVAEPNLMKWAEWFEKNEARRVARDEISKDVSVSTVFLGLDHQFGDGAPLLFETMIFGAPHDQEQWRYSTWSEAEDGHARAVEMAKGAAS